MKELGVGIIGFGFMGKTHTYGYKTIPLLYEGLPFKTRLIGVCDTVREVAENAKESHGFEQAYTDPERLLEREDVDVIDVCTPNVFHKPVIMQALKVGKHVYCDKPLAASYQEAQEILTAADRSTSITQLALQCRFFPVTLRAKEIIDEGRIGRPISFRASYLHSGSVDASKPIGWKQDKQFGGGGVLFDLGSHVIDIVYHLIGGFSEVFAKTDILYAKRPDKCGNMVDVCADDCALVMARMKCGALGVIEASKIATGAEDELRVEIHGDKGAVRFNLMQPNYIEYYDNTLPEGTLGGYKGYTRIACVQKYESPAGKFPPPKFSMGWIRAHVHSQYNFLNCVCNKTPATPSFAEAAYVQYIMEKAYESDSAGRWLKV